MPILCSVPATPPDTCLPFCSMLPHPQPQSANQREACYTTRTPVHPPNHRTRSASPHRRRSTSPNPGPRPALDPNRQSGFQPGAGGNALPACAICLGRFSHRVFECDTPTTWDGLHQTIAKRVRGELLLCQDNQPLCADWQHKRSCTSKRHDRHHLCSGCGQTSHGAQTCPRAQKA